MATRTRNTQYEREARRIEPPEVIRILQLAKERGYNGWWDNSHSQAIAKKINKENYPDRRTVRSSKAVQLTVRHCLENKLTEEDFIVNVPIKIHKKK